MKKALNILKYLPFIFLAVIVLVILTILGGFASVGEVITSMIKKHSIRYGLWMLNLRKSCPYCGDKIITHGFYPDERYTCENMECKFNEVE